MQQSAESFEAGSIQLLKLRFDFANSIHYYSNPDTISLFQTLQQVFSLASNPAALVPTLSASVLDGLPSFEEAANSLRANSGKIFASIIGLKIPREAAKVSSFFKAPNSVFNYISRKS